LVSAAASSHHFGWGKNWYQRQPARITLAGDRIGISGNFLASLWQGIELVSAAASSHHFGRGKNWYQRQLARITLAWDRIRISGS